MMRTIILLRITVYPFALIVLMYSNSLFSQSSPDFVLIEKGNFKTTLLINKLSDEIIISVPESGLYSILFASTEGIQRRRRIELVKGQNFVKIGSLIENRETEISVIGEKDDINGVRLKQAEIKRLPGTFGDSLKAVFNVPGVSQIFQNYNNSSFQSALPIQLSLTKSGTQTKSPDISNSQRGFLVMRGAGSKSNQFYFDDLPFSYPFHADGISSVINNNAIRSLEVYSGAYSTRYGFGTGGVIAVEGFKKREDLTVVNLNTFLIDGYTFKNVTKNLNVNVSGRKYYPNLLLGQLHDVVPNQTLISDYSDYQGRIHWDINSEHSITITSFGAKDFRYPFAKNEKLDANQSSAESLVDGLVVDRDFRTDGLKHIWTPFGSIKNTINVARNYFSERIQNSTYYLDSNDGRISPDGFVKINTVGNDFSQNLNYFEDFLEISIFKKILKLNSGGQYRETVSSFKGKITYLNPKPQFLRLTELIISDPNTNTMAVLDGDKMTHREIGYFSELKFDHLGYSATLGVRRDYYDLSKEWKTNPRFLLAKNFTSFGTTLFGGTGNFSQAPNDISQYSKTIGNPKLKVETSQHSNIGIEQKFLSKYSIKVEGYRNTFDSMAIQDQFVSDSSAANINNVSSLVDQRSSTLIPQRNLNYSNSMTGWSKGIELMIRKEMEEGTGFFGWASYSNSLTKRNRNQPVLSEEEIKNHQNLTQNNRLIYQDNSRGYYTNLYSNGSLEVLRKNSKEELYDLDRTHIFSFVAGWRYLNSFQLGFRYSYLTNYAYTPIIGSEKQQIGYSPIYSNYIRSERLPAYNQIDLRFDKFITTSWGNLNFYLEVVNLTANRIAVSNTVFTSGIPYIPGSNPQTLYINQNGLNIYKHRVPNLNFGLEMKF
nr:TonB-dependent receptor [Leptospira stimsonii]